MSIFSTSGFVSGGGGLPVGRLRLTECSWIGIVMISITRSTSITSISGVVLMSIITSMSDERLGLPTFIAIAGSWAGREPSARGGARRRLGDETYLRNPRP